MDNPPDSTYLTGQRHTSRLWGTSDNFKPLNVIDLPRPEHTLDEDLQKFNPHLPQPGEMISPPDIINTDSNNVPYNQFRSPNSNPMFNQNNYQSQNQIMEQRESLTSILSNLFYDKLEKANKYHHIMSPYSAYYILLCLLIGTTKTSFKELATSMGITSPDILPALTTESIKLHKELINQNGLKIQIVNSFFIDRTYYAKVLDSYKLFIKKVGNIQQVDFKNKRQTASNINYWVKDITRGLINKMVEDDTIGEDTVMMLMNVVYFKADWQNTFEINSTQTQSFQQSTGLKVKIPLMYQKSSIYYLEDSQYQLATLNYKNPNFVMDFILPKNQNNNNVPFPVNNLHQFLEMYTCHQRHQKVEIYIPNFKQESRIELGQGLNKLGVNRIFSQYDAELDNISSPRHSFDRLYVNDIFQKAVIIVNETGTEAAVATAVILDSYNFSPKEKIAVFRADRTFQYCVRYVPTNTILFSGLYDAN